MSEPARLVVEPRGAAATVAVCTPTFRRPQSLARLLDGLAGLRVGDDLGITVKVVVVDNDPDGSAGEIVADLVPRLPWPVEHVVEPERGIPQARNRAVAAAAPFDFIAFIDDDEVPHADWLTELVQAQRATGADIVTGPVIPVFEKQPPRWVVKGRFFERPRFRDLDRLTYARTSSVLVAAQVFPWEGPAFNPAMALTGGSDTHFFMRAVAAGHTIVWADRAIVYELVPESRVRVRWLLQREYRRGQTLSRCLVDLNPSWARRLRRAARGALSIGQGIGVTAVGLVLGRSVLVGGLRRCCYGAGLLTGLLGLTYHEYKVIHGS